MDITFNCDKCGQPIVIDGAGVGLAVACPKCSVDIIVPSARLEQINPVDAQNGYKPCPLCREPVKHDATVCCHCASNLVDGSDSIPQVEGLVATNYQTLRVMSVVMKALAILSLIVGVASAVIVYSNTREIVGLGSGAGVLFAFGCLFAGGISFAVHWAGAESIMVFIDTEENTRTTNALLRLLVARLHREPPSPIHIRVPQSTSAASGSSRVRLS